MIQEIPEDTDVAWMDLSSTWKEDEPDLWMEQSISLENKKIIRKTLKKIYLLMSWVQEKILSISIYILI